MRAPDLGKAGLRAAWRMDRERALKVGPKDWEASLGGWVLECRGDAPFGAWAFWGLSLTHLRPVAGVAAAQLQYPQAAYELVSATIAPGVEDPVEVTDSGKGCAYLLPLDFVIQFHGLDDAGALKATELCVEDVVRGLLSPDSFFKRAWKNALASNGAKFSPRFTVDQVGHA